MQRYPLAWPDGWARTPSTQRKGAKFHSTSRQFSTNPGGGSWLKKSDLTVAAAIKRVLEELARFGVLEGDAIVSTNLVTRLDGLPRSDQRAPQDPGVAVYWQRPGESPKCMAIDIYDTVAGNLGAIAATLEAMRAIERHGGAQILQRAFTGFDALPAPGQTTGRSWRAVLGFPEDARPRLSDVEDAYRRRRSASHPDRPGGSPEEFNAVQRAVELARQEIRG